MKVPCADASAQHLKNPYASKMISYKFSCAVSRISPHTTVCAKAILVAACLLLMQPVPALEPNQIEKSVPTFAQLESAGAVIREIRINPQNIFNLADSDEDNWLFRLANRLHIGTRPTVIEKILLFKSGERVSVQKIEETERLLRSVRFLYDVEIKPVAHADGMVDIEVATRDTWTIDVTGSLSRSGGNNKTSIGIQCF